MTVRHVPRLNGAVWISLLLASSGLVFRESVLVIAATIPLWYLVYSAVTGMGEVEVSIERDCEDLVTAPGTEVPVTLTITNVGSDPISDLRVVDGAPDDLPVVDGSPRTSVALGSGESATLTYALSARRGDHEFSAPTIRARNLVGTIVETRTVEASGTDAIACKLPVEDVPLSDQTSTRAGRVPADEGGSGVEFHAIREYERGDPVRYIDWRRYAKTGDLTTVEFRDERSAIVGIVVDARPEMYVSPAEGEPTGAALSAYAADQAFERLADAGFPTCLVSVTDRISDVVGPGRDAETVREARTTLRALQDADPEWSLLFRRNWSVQPAELAEGLYEQLPGHAQVLVFSPAIDEFPSDLARALTTQGYDVTVVSPDIATRDLPEQQVRSVQRRHRLVELRAGGVGVVDWSPERPLSPALGRAIAGGERR